MSRKSQLNDNAEDTATWTRANTHALLVLLDEFVQKNHREHPVMRNFKVLSEKLLGTCFKRLYATQVKSKYHRMHVVYGKFKKLINHTGFG